MASTRSTVLVLMLLSMALLGSSGCGGGTGPVAVPALDLITLTNWWVTSPDTPLGNAGTIRIVAEFLNVAGGDFEFTQPSPRFQLWTDPSNITPPFVVNAEPTGKVSPGATYTYDLTVDVSDVPFGERHLALRPAENGAFGNLGPRRGQLVSATVTTP